MSYQKTNQSIVSIYKTRDYKIFGYEDDFLLDGEGFRQLNQKAWFDSMALIAWANETQEKFIGKKEVRQDALNDMMSFMKTGPTVWYDLQRIVVEKAKDNKPTADDISKAINVPVFRHDGRLEGIFLALIQAFNDPSGSKAQTKTGNKSAGNLEADNSSLVISGDAIVAIEQNLGALISHLEKINFDAQVREWQYKPFLDILDPKLVLDNGYFRKVYTGASTPLNDMVIVEENLEI